MIEIIISAIVALSGAALTFFTLWKVERGNAKHQKARAEDAEERLDIKDSHIEELVRGEKIQQQKIDDAKNNPIDIDYFSHDRVLDSELPKD